MKLTNRYHKLITAVLGGMALALTLSTASAEEQAKSMQDDFARGAKAWADNCLRCHNARDPQELRDDQWITTTTHMRVRAGLTGQQARDIITFLQKSN